VVRQDIKTQQGGGAGTKSSPYSHHTKNRNRSMGKRVLPTQSNWASASLPGAGNQTKRIGRKPSQLRKNREGRKVTGGRKGSVVKRREKKFQKIFQ